MLQVGNTAVVADMISSAVAVDVFRIEAADPYPDSYDATVERNVREQNAEARPAIAGNLPAVGGYDAVLLGSGIWNVRPPMIMRTFVESVDLSGKTIFPFVTYAVSGLGRTIDDYTRLCPRSTIGEGLAVRGEQVGDAEPTWTRGFGRSDLLRGEARRSARVKGLAVMHFAMATKYLPEQTSCGRCDGSPSEETRSVTALAATARPALPTTSTRRATGAIVALGCSGPARVAAADRGRPADPQFPALLSVSSSSAAWLLTATLLAGAVSAPVLGV